MAEEPEDLLATANLKPLKNNTSDIITAKRTCLDTEMHPCCVFWLKTCNGVLIVGNTFQHILI